MSTENNLHNYSYYRIILLSSYNNKKKLNDYNNDPFVFYILRRISHLIAPLLAVLGFSANFVTFSGVFLLISIPFLYSHYEVDIFYICLFFPLWYLLDCLDGDLARIYNLSSDQGELYDWLSGILAITILPVTILISMQYDTFFEHKLTSFLDYRDFFN